jgi:hypothetical protein
MRTKEKKWNQDFLDAWLRYSVPSFLTAFVLFCPFQRRFFQRPSSRNWLWSKSNQDALTPKSVLYPMKENSTLLPLEILEKM